MSKRRLKVVPLRPPVRKDVIAELEYLLREAKAGRIVSIAYAATTHTRAVLTDSTASENRFAEIGALDYLRHRLLARHIADNDEAES